MLSEEAHRLIVSIQDCERCPSMAGCIRVLSEANGSFSAKVMFVGEAPGRLGADRTAVPFHGDKAGDNFESLLSLSGLQRRDIFVTNAVLCNPRDEKGNNAPPNREVLLSCSHNLRRQIELIQPSLVVTLGSVALEATRLIEAHPMSLSSNVRTSRSWFGRTIAPLYHPGARAMIHRNFITQTSDYYFIGEIARRLANDRKRYRSKADVTTDSWQIVRYVMSQLQSCSLFKLHKTLYLIDAAFKHEFNQTLTSFFYIRQKDGPYCVELGSRWFKAHNEIAVTTSHGQPWLTWTGGGLFDATLPIQGNWQPRVEEVIESIRSHSDRQMKTKAYLTRPMKASIRAERSGLRQLNTALL